jgi:tetratricopeptide (TPR) repeat protein
VPHGDDGFSLMVNFDLLARWWRDRGGVAVLPSEPAQSVVVAALIRGDESHVAQMAPSVRDLLIDLGPDNYLAVRPLLTSAGPKTIESLLACLRLSRFDPAVFAELLPSLLETLPTIPYSMKNVIEGALVRVWKNYYPIGEPIDLALCIGLALSAISRFPEAIDFLERSVKEHHDSPEAAFAMAAARHGQRDLQSAREWVDKALELEPGFPEARALRAILMEELHDEFGA